MVDIYPINWCLPDFWTINRRNGPNEIIVTFSPSVGLNQGNPLSPWDGFLCPLQFESTITLDFLYPKKTWSNQLTPINFLICKFSFINKCILFEGWLVSFNLLTLQGTTCPPGSGTGGSTGSMPWRYAFTLSERLRCGTLRVDSVATSSSLAALASSGQDGVWRLGVSTGMGFVMGWRVSWKWLGAGFTYFFDFYPEILGEDESNLTCAYLSIEVRGGKFRFWSLKLLFVSLVISSFTDSTLGFITIFHHQLGNIYFYNHLKPIKEEHCRSSSCLNNLFFVHICPCYFYRKIPLKSRLTNDFGIFISQMFGKHDFQFDIWHFFYFSHRVDQQNKLHLSNQQCGTCWYVVMPPTIEGI